jgi:hypothetical protein
MLVLPGLRVELSRATLYSHPAVGRRFLSRLQSDKNEHTKHFFLNTTRTLSQGIQEFSLYRILPSELFDCLCYFCDSAVWRKSA